MITDLKYAWRALRHRPLTSLVAVLCLGVGIGANTALFGVLDALLLRPPAGVRAPSELMRLQIGDAAAATRGAGSSVTWPAYEEARDRLAGVAEVAAYAPRMLTLTGRDGGEPLQAVMATGNYFDLLGVRAHRGRLFAPGEDDVRGATPVAVLSHAAWQRRFGADPDIIGQVVQLNGVPVTVAGVAARGFAGVDLGEPEVWLPAGVAALEAFGGANQFTARVYWLQMLTRRAPGATQAAVEHVASGAGADPYAGPRPAPLHALPLRAVFFADQRGANPVPPWAIGITVAVLLLACATVANLLLAQNAVREREIAVRLALGAPRARVLRQLLTENLLIALAAAACATVLATWSSGLLRTLPIPVIPRLVDLRVTAFAFVVAIATTLLFGVLPAVRAARGDLDAVLRSGGRSSARQNRLQHGLMVAQIALCFTLLVGAGLFLASFRNAQRIDTGFDLQQLLTVAVPLGAAPAAERALLVEQAMEHVASLPGVEAVGAGSIVPFYFMSRGSFEIPDGRDEMEQPMSLLVNAVTGDYLRTMGITMTAGRMFDARDAPGSAPVALVSESVARTYWSGDDVVGRCIRLTVPHGDACVTVVGVARDVHFDELRGEPSHILYLAAAQDPRGGTPSTLFVRTRGTPADMAGAVRRAVQGIGSGSLYAEVQPLDVRARPQRIQWEVAATLFTAFGIIAALLAAVGLYMVVAFIVAQRTREIGVRMALGATRGAVLRLVLGRGVRLTGAGIVAGALCSLALGRVLASRLYGISPADAATYTGVALLLTVVAVAATALPARAAASLEPMRVLRDE
jgi:putative ABC transport system permease protein